MSWQPIETALKDRDVLLFVTETAEQFVAFWGEQIDTGNAAWVFGRARDEDGNRISMIVREPTHWMPLPAPPEV